MKPFLITIAFLILAGRLTAQVTDKEGNNYKTVKIGKQEWTAENLNTSHFRNGDIIPEVNDAAEWVLASRLGKPAWCYYNNDTANKKYGKLYNGYAVNDRRGLAPDGWHIPSFEDWKNLVSFLGKNKAEIKMKASVGWDGTNESGFAGLPGGCRGWDSPIGTGMFKFIGENGLWWTSTYSQSVVTFKSGITNSIDENMLFGLPVLRHWPRYTYEAYLEDGLSVRCVKD